MSEPPPPPTSAPPRPRWSTTTKVVVVVLILLGALALAHQVGLIVTPMALAVILAFILNPVVGFVSRRVRVPRLLVLILIYVLFAAALSAVLALVTPLLIQQIRRLTDGVPEMLGRLQQTLDRRLVLGPLVLDLSGLLGETETLLLNAVQSIGSESINFLGSVLGTLAEAGVAVIFTLIVSFYLIKDGARALEWFYSLAPPVYQDDLRRLADEINLIWGAFFRGQIVLTMVVAVIVGTVATVIGLPSPLLMGVLAGLLELLPSLGHGIWLVTAVLLALFAGSTWDWMPLSNFWFAVLIVGLHVVFQQVDLNFLIPRIIGRRVQLHPVIVIVGILIGASLAGVLGIFVAAPTIATLRVLGRYVHANLMDMDPFPPEPPPEAQGEQEA